MRKRKLRIKFKNEKENNYTVDVNKKNAFLKRLFTHNYKFK